MGNGDRKNNINGVHGIVLTVLIVGNIYALL